MPQVVVHASKKLTVGRKTRMISEMRDAIPKLLDIPDHIGQVIVYEIPPENYFGGVTHKTIEDLADK